MREELSSTFQLSLQGIKESILDSFKSALPSTGYLRVIPVNVECSRNYTVENSKPQNHDMLKTNVILDDWGLSLPENIYWLGMT